jgi:hypothetical protein
MQVVYLISKRVTLRARNLTSPTLPPASAIRENGTPLDTRTHEGSLNNQKAPTMAMTGCPFIRNTPAAPGNPKVGSSMQEYAAAAAAACSKYAAAACTA